MLTRSLVSLSYQRRAPPFWSACQVRFVKWFASTPPSSLSLLLLCLPFVLCFLPNLLSTILCSLSLLFVSVARPTFLVCLSGAFRQMVRKYKAIRRDFIVSRPIIVNANPVYLVPFLPVARPTFLVCLSGAFRQMVLKYTAIRRELYSFSSYYC